MKRPLQLADVPIQLMREDELLVRVLAHTPQFQRHSSSPTALRGIIGYRCLRLTGLLEHEWKGTRLGIYGFGAAGHNCIQLARACDIFWLI